MADAGRWRELRTWGNVRSIHEPNAGDTGLNAKLYILPSVKAMTSADSPAESIALSSALWATRKASQVHQLLIDSGRLPGVTGADSDVRQEE